MKKKITLRSIILGMLLIAGTGSALAEDDLTGWQLPSVPDPKDNPRNAAKVALGYQLSFDNRLSKNDALSCASCHLPSTGGGGPTPRAFGQGGELGRWAPSWINSGYYTSLFWDGRAASLEEQTGALPGHMGPITAPGEMGSTMAEVITKLNNIPEYKKQFHAIYGTDATPEAVAQSIAAFERTLNANNAPFQRYVKGDAQAISTSAKRGFELYRGKAACVTCHAPPLLTDNAFHNLSVPQVGPLKVDMGRYDVTKDAADKGKFKTPTLYNASSFAFFMHDGAFSKMDQVIEHYNKGGDPKNPGQDALIFPLNLTPEERADLIAFLESLTDKGLNEMALPKLP